MFDALLLCEGPFRGLSHRSDSQRKEKKKALQKEEEGTGMRITESEAFQHSWPRRRVLVTKAAALGATSASRERKGQAASR